MYKEDLALNNLQFATKPNPTKSYISNIYVSKGFSIK